MYHQAEISLIDDALSAVDAHVAKQIFETVLVGDLLKPCRAGQQRILFFATNALQYLNHPRVDKIIVMQDGRIAEQGTFASLSNDSESVFTRFLSAIKDADVSTNLAKSGPSPVQRLSSPTAIGFKANESELDPTPNLMKEESRQVGRVGWNVYQTWIRAAGGFFVPLAILLLFAAVEGMSVLSNWWLTYWSGHAASESQTAFLGIYALINLTAAVAGFFRVLAIAVVGLKASRAVRRPVFSFLVTMYRYATVPSYSPLSCSSTANFLLVFSMHRCHFLTQPPSVDLSIDSAKVL